MNLFKIASICETIVSLSNPYMLIQSHGKRFYLLSLSFPEAFYPAEGSLPVLASTLTITSGKPIRKESETKR
jgi:hypothetical protein